MESILDIPDIPNMTMSPQHGNQNKTKVLHSQMNTGKPPPDPGDTVWVIDRKATGTVHWISSLTN